jgi:hypothetical protein
MTPIQSTCELSRKELMDVPHLLHQAAKDSDPGNMFMRMFYILSACGQNALALEMQQKALAYRCIYRLSSPPAASLRLLAIVGPGNMRDNTPLDFLVEHSDIRLDLLYVSAALPPPASVAIPCHDIAFIAPSAADKHLPALKMISGMLETWQRPIINHPQKILNCVRETASQLLQDVPGLRVPHTERIKRDGKAGYAFPITLRPAGTHSGNGLEKIDDEAGLKRYLEAHAQRDAFYISEYVDYKSQDKLYRKLRIVLIDHQPYICHMAISEHWIVHYSSANMTSFAQRRAEEKRMMESFDTDFAVRHGGALKAIAERLDLDYVVIDCGETHQGELLFFEADTVGWVHATDPVDVFPYKPAVMQKAFDAFRTMLIKKAQRSAAATVRSASR